MKGDFDGITGFIASEFVKIAKANNGVIDVKNPFFVKAAYSGIVEQLSKYINLNDSEISTMPSSKKDVQALAGTTIKHLISETLGKKKRHFMF